jgi:hypothetical protein
MSTMKKAVEPKGPVTLTGRRRDERRFSEEEMEGSQKNEGSLIIHLAFHISITHTTHLCSQHHAANSHRAIHITKTHQKAIIQLSDCEARHLAAPASPSL